MTSDLALSILIGAVESEEVQALGKPLLITLNVGGILISGELIGEKRWYEEFMGGSLLQKIKEVITSNVSLKAEIQQSPKEGESDFIHLRNAKFFTPGQQPLIGEDKGVLWRGRLDCVDGWVLGGIEIRVGSG